DHLMPESGTASVVYDHVSGNGEQPRTRGLSVGQHVRVLPRLEQGFLHYVLGVGMIAGQPPRIAPQSSGVLVAQPLQGVRIGAGARYVHHQPLGDDTVEVSVRFTAAETMSAESQDPRSVFGGSHGVLPVCRARAVGGSDRP